MLLEVICCIFPIAKPCAYVFFCLDKCYPVNEHNKTSVYLNAIKKNNNNKNKKISHRYKKSITIHNNLPRIQSG